MKPLPVILTALLLLSSCRTAKEVRTEYVRETRTDTLLLVKERFDSVFVQDKTNVYTKGDTVFVERWKYVYKDRQRTDTLWRTKTETLTLEVEKESVREVNRLKWWQKALMWSGAVSLGILGLLLLWKLKGKIW